MMDNIKLLVKLSTDDNESKWTHLCYIDRDLHNNYTDECEHINKESLSRWCKEDFGVDMKIDTAKDLDKLRSMVKGYYSEKYPEIYQESVTDHQGWFRMWVTNKMKEELHGKVSV